MAAAAAPRQAEEPCLPVQVEAAVVASRRLKMVERVRESMMLQADRNLAVGWLASTPERQWSWW